MPISRKALCLAYGLIALLAGTLGTFDVIGLMLVTVAIMVYAAIALLR